MSELNMRFFSWWNTEFSVGKKELDAVDEEQ